MGNRGGHVENLADALTAVANTDGLLGLSEILPRLARGVIGADGATFIMREGDLCHYLTEDAMSPLWAGERFPMGACVSGWVIIHREAAAIANIYADDRVPVDAYRPTFVTSMAMVPVRAAEPVGAIGVYWAESHRPTARELAALSALAESASLALERAEDELQPA